MFLGLCSQYWGGYNCYASADIKALETLGYAEHICNFFVISDSWFYGKVSVVGTPSNLGLISLDITGFLMLRIVSIYRNRLIFIFLVKTKVLISPKFHTDHAHICNFLQVVKLEYEDLVSHIRLAYLAVVDKPIHASSENRTLEWAKHISGLDELIGVEF